MGDCSPSVKKYTNIETWIYLHCNKFYAMRVVFSILVALFSGFTEFTYLYVPTVEWLVNGGGLISSLSILLSVLVCIQVIDLGVQGLSTHCVHSTPNSHGPQVVLHSTESSCISV
jgi:hypothetical protein